MSMNQGSAPIDEPRICPHCGYDLRMLDSERCPECGEKIDPRAIAQPRIPWALRRHRGVLRSYLATLWMTTIGVRKLCEEIERPVSYRDARRFWWITSFLVALPLMLLFVAIWLKEGHHAPGTPGWPLMDNPTDQDERSFFYDVHFPWLVGVQFSPLMLVWIFLAVLTNLGMPSYLMDRLHQGERRGRAIALSYYGCGSLFGFAFFGLISAGYYCASEFSSNYAGQDRAEILAAIFGLAALPFILLYWFRTESLVSRLNPGRATGWWAVFGLPVFWSLNWGWWIFGLPWLLGYAWILFWTW